MPNIEKLSPSPQYVKFLTSIYLDDSFLLSNGYLSTQEILTSVTFIVEQRLLHQNSKK
jgi:hypothetical protein